MDMKEKSLIVHYHNKFSQNTFDEKDVYAFLILIRNQSKGIKCINELADFIAHRDKDRGLIKEYLDLTQQKFNNFGKEDMVIEIKEVFSFKEIKAGVNKILQEIGLEGLSNEKINDLLTCIISILQHVKITDGKGRREIGKLYFSISNKQISLLGKVKMSYQGELIDIVFPVLSVKNNYIKLEKQGKQDTPIIFTDDIIEVVNKKGTLEFIKSNG
ncbi:hypothetical protein [Priestia megaterium]|uniref:hypothetical protein n=1 Tax=Priestia megaterium TaxID=1404 RepID=UPI0005C73582|nr:hypothetical protein [Priestia megaterium]